MQCDNCGERPAAIHLTQIVNDSVNTVHLCEECAAEKGVQTGASVAKFPLSDFLASMGTGESKKKGVAGRRQCPECGATLADFREAGRVGCARCYDTFADHLRDLLRRLHGASQHVGRPYAGAHPPETQDGESLGELRRQLRDAVEAENFERAAELRDRIRVLE